MDLRVQAPEEELGVCLLAALLFLDCFSFVLCPLPSLISSCLTLPFGTQGGSRRLKPFFLQTRNREHREAFVPGRALEDPAPFQSPPFFDALQSGGGTGVGMEALGRG